MAVKLTKMKITNRATGAVRFQDVHPTRVFEFMNHIHSLPYDRASVAL